MNNFYTNVQVHGNTILLKAVENGVRKKFKIEYQPTMYAKAKGNRSSNFHTLTGEPVDEIQFGSIKETRAWIRQNKNFELFGNTQFQYAFIADEYPQKELSYDMKDIMILNLDIEHESEGTFGQDSQDTALERINVITFKDFRKEEYFVFTFTDHNVYGEHNHYKPPTDGTVKHFNYDSEEEMLHEMVKWLRKMDPDVISGWNVMFYDIPYIYNRITMLLGEDVAKKLSPWGVVEKKKVLFMHQERNTIELTGISTLDYFYLYKKNIPDPRENYKLGYIAEVELGETKIDWQEKYASMKEFYTKDFQMFVEYNIQDVRLPDKLEKKRNLIQLVIDVAYTAKVNYTDVLSQTRAWDMLIYNWLKQDNIVIPFKEFQEKDEQFIGAYVKVPVPGLYNYILSFDVASLYPSIIMAMNIGPETKVERFPNITHEDFLTSSERFQQYIFNAIELNLTAAANGVMYSKEKQSFYSCMITTFFTNRKMYQADVRKAKKELEICTDPKLKIELSNTISKFDLKQYALKILMNSLYGAFGCEYFRYFDLENAEAVTMTGQFIIQHIQSGINIFLNKEFKTENIDYVVYSDTDSVFVVMDKLVQIAYKGNPPEVTKCVRFLDRVSKEKIEPEIDRLFGEITDKYINGMKAKSPILNMKREVIADRGIWASKKHYILNVWNSEGDNYFKCNDCSNEFSGPSEIAACNKCKSVNTVRVPKMKIKGFDMVKSSLPKFTKDAMKTAVNIVMNGTQNELVEFIDKKRIEFYALPLEDVAFPRSANNLGKWEDEDGTYSKGTPIAVKGVLIYNETLKTLGLENKYPPLSAGKIKYIHLKKPNPVNDKVIAFDNKLPEEFGLHKYIDYKDMFEGTLIKPLEKILDPIGWGTEKPYDDMDAFLV